MKFPEHTYIFVQIYREQARRPYIKYTRVRGSDGERMELRIGKKDKTQVSGIKMNEEHRRDVTVGLGGEEWAPSHVDPDSGGRGRTRHLWGNCDRSG